MKKSDLFPSKRFKAQGFDGPQALTIESVAFEEFEGRNGGVKVPKPVLHFAETTSTFVVGATVFDEIAEATGEGDTDNWPTHRIELYLGKAQYMGSLVDSIRVRKPTNGAAGKQRAAVSKVKPKPETPLDDSTDEIFR